MSTPRRLKFQTTDVCDIRKANLAQSDGLLSGLTVSVKDLFAVKGFKTGAGLPEWERLAHIEEKHADAVELLINQGAKLTSKTQLDELAYSLNGDNSHFGVSVNPCDHKRLSGGSSSGAAVSVAKGESDIGLATDTGGSIRVPASYCGLWGMRPTYASISTKGLVPLAPRFDTAGVLCRDGETLKLAYQVLQNKATEQKKDTEQNTATDINAIQLAWCDSLWDGVDSQLKQYAWRCFQQFTGSKIELEPPVLDAEQRRVCFSILQANSIWQTHGDWLAENLSHFGDDIASRLKWGQNLTQEQIDNAESQFTLWQQHKQSWLPSNTVVLMPTVPSVAPLIAADDQVKQREILLGLTSIAGLSGWPQLQCPAITHNNAPIGISLLGREDSDLELIELAQVLFAD